MDNSRPEWVICLIPRIRSPHLKAEYPVLGPQVSVGRHSTNGVCLPMESVSRFHARLEQRGDGLYLVDLGSRNGSFINQARVNEGVVEDGDEVAFGNIVLNVHIRRAGERNQADSTARNVRVQSPGAEGMQSLVRKSIKSDTTRHPAFGYEVANADAVARAQSLLSALFQFNTMLANQTEEQEIYESLLDLIFEALPCDRGVILARSAGEESFQPVRAKIRDLEAAGEIAISQTIIDRCLREQVAILSRDAMADSRFGASDSIVLHDIRSAMCAPLVSRGQALAVCFVDASESRRVFADADLEFFASLCGEVAILLDNARMYRELLLHERMAAIGQTVAGIAHNLKNVLLLSQGGIDLIDNCLERRDYRQVGETWELIKRGLDRINALVKEMLDFSRERECQKAPGHINEVVDETVALIREEFEHKGIALRIQLDDSIPAHWIDGEGVERALMNLLLNAAEAIETPPGLIEVDTALVDGDAIRLTVADNGCGISAAQLPCIFQAFYSTKGSKGTGLGLPMTRKLIESMGGNIRCRSAEDSGTVFEIQLPLETVA